MDRPLTRMQSWLVASCLLLPTQPAFGQPAAKPPTPTAAPIALEPLITPSLVLATITVPLGVIRDQLQDAIPPSESGAKSDPIGNPVVDDVLEWNFERSPLSVTAGNAALSVATTIAGTVRVKGNVRLIRGSIGKFLGKLNPTNIPFSAHAELRAVASAQARPQLMPNWRIQPNLSLSAQVQQAEIPINHVGTISVRGHVQGPLDAKLAQLRGQLESKMREDRRIEAEARKAWDKLCQASPLDIDRDGKPDLYLRVTPMLARATQPRIDEQGITLQVGIEANSEISRDAAKPDCPFPEVLQLLPMEEPRFDLTLPLDLAFDQLNVLVGAQMPKTVERADYGLKADVKKVVVSAGDATHLALSVDATVTETRWFGKSVTGTFLVRAKPKLDPATQRITFENVELDVKSRDAFGITELLAKGATPLLAQWIGNNLSIDVAKEAARFPLMAEAAVAKLNQKSAGLDITAQFDPPRMVGLDFDATRLRLIAEAHGKVTAVVK